MCVLGYRSAAPQLSYTASASWSFDPPIPDSPRPSIFSSPTSTSRFAVTPPVRIPDRTRLLGGDEPARTPPPALSILEPLSSSPEDWRVEEDEVRATVNRRRLPRVEKDVDDPTQTDNARPGRHSHNRTQSTTLTTLSRLFAVKAATSPTDIRDHSFSLQSDPRPRRSITGENVPLPEHLYTRGLLGGKHSDIVVHAFGCSYKLHRILLDRAPFFASALSGPWLESNAKEMTLNPNDIDDNITQISFELALKRLYGAGNPDEEEAEAVALFCTGAWLEMPDLVDSSIESIMRQMTPENLAPLIKLVTKNYYGRPGDKILASAKAMLCRDGWRMPLAMWDSIPGDIVREIVGGDGFFIDGEWSRWVLAKRILDRRLKRCALDAGLVDPRAKHRVMRAPDAANLMAVRFDNVYRKNAMANASGMPDTLYKWIALYTNPDIEPILVLLDEGIHYVHLPFEQLQYIRRARDVLGLPILPERIMSNALWMQIELRQKVLNAQDSQMELGLSQVTDSWRDHADGSWGTGLASADPISPSKGKQRADESSDYAIESAEEDIASDSWDCNGKPRKFWIPSSDCNIVMGGNGDPVIATASTATPQNHNSRLSATIQPEDVVWASDFAAVASDTRPSTSMSPGRNINDMRPVAYSHFPPFRFAAEFPKPRLLKEKKRVYSQTVFYLGSFWNVYVQRVRRGKNPQLGVYLHRAKEREGEEVVASNGSIVQGSVDERIGQLERDMLARQDRRIAERRRMIARHRAGLTDDLSDGGGDGSSTDLDTTLVGGAEGSTGAGLLGRKTSQTADEPSGSARQAPNADEEDTEDPELIRLTRDVNVPTLPPYRDTRPTIRTYFKIYSPSKGGRMLSVYESAPDTFNFSQSWGWKSSTLMLDDGLLPDEGTDDMDMPLGGIKRDGKLRFMIVIGNV
ncbi:hypothetical protein BDV97DRAFT_377164 [Delphinella strobiligena]|nr:hypothetical protein BDV97DRAFT_377164 [Delphinella strobiligena]